MRFVAETNYAVEYIWHTPFYNLSCQFIFSVLTERVHKTKGIVLRYVKYGETSIIASVYTELFGLQSYLLKGVRAISKKGGTRIVFFQPAAILEMEVYHNEFKQLNHIKEYRFACIYNNIFTDVIKNGVAVYMIELLSQCLKEPINDANLFGFVEECLVALDGCDDSTMANFPIFFGLHLANFFGLQPRNIAPGIWESDQLVFDIEEGVFTTQPVFHQAYLSRKYALVLAELLQVRHPSELAEIETNAEVRRKILEGIETYYNRHIQDFGRMKTLPVLIEIMK